MSSFPLILSSIIRVSIILSIIQDSTSTSSTTRATFLSYKELDSTSMNAADPSILPCNYAVQADGALLEDDCVIRHGKIKAVSGSTSCNQTYDSEGKTLYSIKMYAKATCLGFFSAFISLVLLHSSCRRYRYTGFHKSRKSTQSYDINGSLLNLVLRIILHHRITKYFPVRVNRLSSNGSRQQSVIYRLWSNIRFRRKNTLQHKSVRQSHMPRIFQCLHQLGTSTITPKDSKKSVVRRTGQRAISSRMVKCLTNVEAFSLEAADLEYVANHFSRYMRNPRVQGAIRYESPYWRSWAARRIQAAWKYRKSKLNKSLLADDHARIPN